ncbi:MAG: hypothetical protein WCJ87_04150 [Burkholderiales bacterium]
MQPAKPITTNELASRLARKPLFDAVPTQSFFVSVTLFISVGVAAQLPRRPLIADGERRDI